MPSGRQGVPNPISCTQVHHPLLSTWSPGIWALSNYLGPRQQPLGLAAQDVVALTHMVRPYGCITHTEQDAGV